MAARFSVAVFIFDLSSSCASVFGTCSKCVPVVWFDIIALSWFSFRFYFLSGLYVYIWFRVVGLYNISLVDMFHFTNLGRATGGILFLLQLLQLERNKFSRMWVCDVFKPRVLRTPPSAMRRVFQVERSTAWSDVMTFGACTGRANFAHGCELAHD